MAPEPYRNSIHYVADPPREFVMFIEKDRVEHDFYIYYIQYTGNEEVIHALAKIFDCMYTIEQCKTHQCSFEIIADVTYTEDFVNQACRVPYMFTKCGGTFQVPRNVEEAIAQFEQPPSVPIERIITSDFINTFNKYKIQRLFSDYRDIYYEFATQQISYEEFKDYMGYTDEE